jgi:Predicted membrane protein/domain
MADWWYADKDKKTGPVEITELGRLLQTGKISPKTMVWQESMDAWQPLDKVDGLSALKATLPPPCTSYTSYPLATRWPRFFARIFDVWWEILLTSVALGAVLGRYSAGFVEWINVPGASQLFGILCLPVALILDAVLYRLLGNTPGKALLGLKVTTLDGKPLSFAQYLGRNFSLWVSGFALGFPLINLFTLANQSRRLGKGQPASYDEATDFRVRSKPSGILRKAVFGLAFTGLFVVMAVLNSMEQAAQREVILNSGQENYSQ